MNLKSVIGKGFLAFSILFGLGIASSETAQAQWQDPYYRTQRDYEREQRRRQREYERQQRRDQRRYERSGGYYGNNGDRPNDGYRNYGGSFDLRQTALNAGANDGVKEGRKDRERGERFNYTDEDAYQKATHDYSSRLGDRYIYQRYYRDAFVNGYTEGYRGY